MRDKLLIEKLKNANDELSKLYAECLSRKENIEHEYKARVFELIQAQEDNKRLREVLEFYAAEDNYYIKMQVIEPDDGTIARLCSATGTLDNPVEIDKGQRARDALEKP